MVVIETASKVFKNILLTTKLKLKREQIIALSRIYYNILITQCY